MIYGMDHPSAGPCTQPWKCAGVLAPSARVVLLATGMIAGLGLSSAAIANQPKKQTPATAPPATTSAKPAADPAPAASAPPTAAELAEAAARRKVEMAAARARCTAILAKIDAVTIAKEPIEDGQCGDIAPVELVSIGKNPAVAVSPTATLTCDMVVALHDWMKADVQPLARKHLGKEVVRLETMSSYSCRNAYGRTLSKLSEHGKANALDIRGFVTSSGQTAYVLTDWGMTSGEIRAAAAAAEKEQTRIAAEKAEADAKARALAAAKVPPSAARDKTAPTTNPLANAGTIVDGLPKPSFGFTGKGSGDSSTSFSLSPSRLGGPKPPPAKGAPKIPEQQAIAPQGMRDPRQVTNVSLFLRAVHDSACGRFHTTLGPETNAAHRNHFHLDLAQRKSSKVICE